ncbi:DM13 domain-containing protein [Mycobacterium sp. ST-F2]|uniref:DM13 domain-containing protein n=1 Tax=Mycobacterium sp. ST-F2 TaxID=1490484 RepID=UPI000B02356B|nr:DM13 domain-containing protein [Mycobacterium sp. ST-F2]
MSNAPGALPNFIGDGVIGTPRRSKEFHMVIKPIVATAAAVFALTLTACGANEMKSAGSSSPASAAMTSAMTSAAMTPSATTRMGEFTGLNGKHVAGAAKVTGGNLEFSNFTSDEGPDLHVYLTKGSTESDVAAGKQISAIKYDQATQSFPLTGIDTAGYTTVVIHCDKAKAVFGAASLM